MFGPDEYLERNRVQGNVSPSLRHFRGLRMTEGPHTQLSGDSPDLSFPRHQFLQRASTLLRCLVFFVQELTDLAKTHCQFHVFRFPCAFVNQRNAQLVFDESSSRHAAVSKETVKRIACVDSGAFVCIPRSLSSFIGHIVRRPSSLSLPPSFYRFLSVSSVTVSLNHFSASLSPSHRKLCNVSTMQRPGCTGGI